jgi:hypothetical protein
MNVDVEIIAIASCALFIIGIALWLALSSIKARLDRPVPLIFQTETLPMLALCRFSSGYRVY